MRGGVLVIALSFLLAGLVYFAHDGSVHVDERGLEWSFCPRGGESCMATDEVEVSFPKGLESIKLPAGTRARVYDLFSQDHITFTGGSHKCTHDICKRDVRVKFFGKDVRWMPAQNFALRVCDSQLEKCRKMPPGYISSLDLPHMYYIQTLLPDYLILLVPEDPLRPIRPCWSGGACIIHEPYRTKEALLVRNSHLSDTITFLGMFPSGRGHEELAHGEEFNVGVPGEFLLPQITDPEQVTLILCTRPSGLPTLAGSIAPHWSPAPMAVLTLLDKPSATLYGMRAIRSVTDIPNLDFGIAHQYRPIAPADLLPTINTTSTWPFVVVDSPTGRCEFPKDFIIEAVRKAISSSFDFASMASPQLIALSENGVTAQLFSIKERSKVPTERIVGILFPRRSVAMAAIKAMPAETNVEGSIVHSLIKQLVAAKQ